MKNKITSILLLTAVFFAAAATEVFAQIPTADLRLHLKADEGVTTVGENVSAWADQSGNGLSNTVQGTDANRPELVSGVINGRPALRFSGGQFLTMPDASEIDIAASDYEMFIVYRSLTSNSDVEFILAGGTEHFELHTNGGGGLRYIPNMVGAANNSERYIDLGTAGQFTNAEPHIIRLQATVNSGVISVGASSIERVKDSQSNYSSTLYLGQREGGSYRLNGDIAEVIIYNASLSTEDREAVEEYLNDKYFGVEVPVQQAANVLIDEITGNSMRVSVDAGDGKGRIIVARAAAVDFVPANNTTYTANAVFGASEEQGDGNFVVYAGTGTEVTATGLNAGTTYHFAVFEYNGSSGFETYLTTNPATNSATPPVFAGGDGTEFSPYQIETPEQLHAIRDFLSGYFVLNNDIDLATYLSEGNPGYNDGAGWDPIGTSIARFTGTFDGNGYTISNLYVERSNFFSSLFGRTENAELRNLILQDVDVRGINDYKGGLVGWSGSTLIENVHVTGSVIGHAQIGGLIGYSTNSTIQGSSSTANITSICTSSSCYDAGGLVGRADGGIIKYSYATGDVFGNNNVGGLVGLFHNAGAIEDSYATGSVSATIGVGSGTNQRAGGLIGNNSISTITRSYSTGSVVGSSEVGGLAGSSSGTITNSYWNTETSGLETSAGGEGLTTAGMRDSNNFTGFNFSAEGYWDIFESYSFPFLRDNPQVPPPGLANPFAGGSGTAVDPFPISTPEELSLIRHFLSAHFILNNDINLDIAPYNEVEGWNPIGTSESAFTGSLDGNNFAIQNLFIQRTTNYQGLFGKLSGTVRDLDLPNISIVIGDLSVNKSGSLAGEISDGIVSRMAVSGTITSGNGSAHTIGGLTGEVSTSDFEDINISVDISIGNGYPYSIGGAFGNIYNLTNIVNVVVTGDVIANAGDDYASDLGGFAGYANGNISISNSSASGNVDGTENLGGFIGTALGGITITESFAAGLVTSKATGANIGGFIGSLGNQGATVENSYAKGDVTVNTAGSRIGGFAGSIGYSGAQSNPVTISGSYSTGSVTSNGQYVGGFAGKISDFTTISNSYTAGSVSGNEDVGGFFGEFDGTGSIVNSYATGQVTGTTSVGGFGGSSNGTITSSYWNTETSGQATSAAGTPKTTAELTQMSTFADWNFMDTWQITEGATLPWLRGVAGNHRIGAITLTGSEGWRLLAGPMADQNYGSMISTIWTQGFEGANSSDGATNVFTWDNSSTGSSAENWLPLDNMSNTFLPGTGLLVYVFSDDDINDDQTDTGFPKTLHISGFEPEGDQDMTSLLNPNEDGWSLLGNPFAATIGWDVFTGSSGLSNSVYVLDEAGQQWLTWNGSIGTLTDGEIAAFKSFFVHTNGGNPSLTIPQSAKTGAGLQMMARVKEISTDGKQAYMSLVLEHQDGFSSKAWFQFSQEGKAGLDRYDAYKLTPLNEPYVSLGSVLNDSTILDINSLPFFEDPVAIEIPLQFITTESGTFTIVKADMNIPEDWIVQLTDHQTGETSNLEEGYIFTVDQPKAKTAPKDMITSRFPMIAASTNEDPRFMLKINPGLDGGIGGPGLPQEVALQQNYPNPFNPVTVIGYQLPVTSDVRLEVFDMIGRRVAVLINGEVQAGVHELRFNAAHLASGVYMYRLQAGSEVLTRKLTLIK